MTTVNGDLVNVLGVKQDGVVRIASSLTRPDGSQVIVDDWDEVYVKAGKFTASVAPGPARFHVVAGSTSKVFDVMVPKTGTVSFASLLEDVVEWYPEVVSRAAMEARAAAKSAKEAAASASDAKAGADRVGTAEQVGKWASVAGSSADAASKSATAADGSAKAAKADAGKAATSATNADKSATAASGSASAAKASADNAGKSATAADGSATAADKSRSDASSFANSAKTASESAAASEKAAAGSASAAKSDAGKARSSEEAAWSYRTVALDARDKAVESATGAAGSADAAKGSADSAGKSATAAAGSASAAKSDAGKAATSATAAGKSATSAKAEADRAASIASTTSWDGDKLTVNGKTSPSLTGPRGLKGEPGDAARATTTEYGSIKLSGDLGGTPDEPRVVSPLAGSIIPFEGDRQSWAALSGLEKVVDDSAPPGAYYTLTKNTVFDERAFRVTPGVPYYFAVWIKSDKPGQKTYLEVRKHGDLGSQTLSVESGTIGESNASYFIGDAEVPTEWTLWETVIRFRPSASKLVIGRWYPNHSRGKERNAQLMVGDIMLTPLSPDLEARKSVAEVQGLTANAVGNEANKITRNASANQLVKTGTDGSIWIQTVAVSDQHHAANKAYVDGAVRGKADAAHTHTSADISDATNDAGSPEFAGKVLKGRNSDGRIFYYSDPAVGVEIARKSYVDGTVDSALRSVAKGDFELRVASSAPSSGTASNVITFVKE